MLDEPLVLMRGERRVHRGHEQPVEVGALEPLVRGLGKVRERAAECNPTERVCWHLHDEITRNHSCKTIQELLDLVLKWLESRNPLPVEGSVYPQPKVA